MNLYDYIVQEVEAWNHFPHTYNLNDLKSKLNPLLEATKQATLHGVHVEHISLTEDMLEIGYEYSARGHVDFSDVQLPVSILKAADPLLQAKRYTLEEELKIVEAQKTAAARTITICLNKEANIKEQLAALNSLQAVKAS